MRGLNPRKARVAGDPKHEVEAGRRERGQALQR